MTKYCPYCLEELPGLNYTANFSEMSYGVSNGIYNLNSGHEELEETEITDSGDFEETDFKYTCPSCGEDVEIDALLDELEKKEEEKKEEEKKAEEDIDAFNLANLRKK